MILAEPPDTPGEWMTAEAASKHLGMSRAAATRVMRAFEVATMPGAGKRILYRRADVEAVAELRAEAKPRTEPVRLYKRPECAERLAVHSMRVVHGR